MRKRLIYLHFAHAFTFFLLLASGLSLYIPAARTWFNQLRFPLVQVHLVFSCFYIVIVIISLWFIFSYLLNKPLLKKFNVWLTLTFASLWMLSGVIMYFQTYMPVGVRNLAVIIHDWSTFLFIPWALTHSIGHLLKIRISWPKWWRAKAPVPEVITENRPERRDVVKFLTVGSLFIIFGGLTRWFLPILSIPSEEVRRRGYFRIYNITNDFPRYESNDWALKIDGLVNSIETINQSDLPRFPSTTIVDDFHCVTGWSVRGVEMKGILVKDLLEELNIVPSGKFVTAYSGDKEYFDSFTISQLLEEEALLVYEIDGLPLKNVQGYPCRLYHPSMYGYKSVKWIERLEFTEDRKLGYWQQSGGYDIDGYL